MGWRPKSLLESIVEGADFPRDRHGRYQCPSCKAFRHVGVIIDVRHLPISEDFACDVCWTQWQRTDRIVDGGGPINGRFDWRLRWVIAHRAPTEIVEKFQSLAQR